MDNFGFQSRFWCGFLNSFLVVTVAPDTLHHGESDSELRSSRGSDPAEIQWRTGRCQMPHLVLAENLATIAKSRS